MFYNYLKLAIKVLLRKKFFTFISLFGISFTLMVLMVYTAFLDTQLGSNAPLTEKERMIFMERLEMAKEYFDTIPKIDTIVEAGITRYDTTDQINSVGNSRSSSYFDINFQEKYYGSIDGAVNHSFYSPSSTFDVFVNNAKLTINAIHTDHRFFQILDFDFKEGQPWSEQELNNANPIIVITDEMADSFFGTDRNVLGKSITLENQDYQVTGVVRKPGNNMAMVAGDVFIPHTLMKRYSDEESYFGGFKAIFLAASANGLKKIKESLAFTTSQIPFLPKYDFNEMNASTYDYDELYALGFHEYKYYQEPAKGKRIMYYILAAIVLLFSIVPILNLINLNVTRIYERSSEIGVRKAFGAKTGNILTQFVFENVIQTLIGGIIGLILAILLIKYINESNALDGTRLITNYKFFIYSFFICVFFGICSGLFPAWRMSKLNIAQAIKSNKL